MITLKKLFFTHIATIIIQGKRRFLAHSEKVGFCQYVHTYLTQTPGIGQGLGRFLSCGARKQEQT